MKNLAGWLILGASAGILLLFLVHRCVRWNRRWSVDRYNGVRVRYDFGAVSTPEIGMQLAESTQAIREALADWYPHRPDLADYRVEIVPVGQVRTPTVPIGTLRDGTRVGASFRCERLFPLGRRHWVVVVTAERSGIVLLHTVLRHLVAYRTLGHPDFDHAYKPLNDMEAAVQAALEARLAR